MEINKTIRKRRIIILSMLSIVVVLLVIIALLLTLFDNKTSKSRTVMIYLDGSNLESESGIPTVDLESIIPQNVDLNKTKVLVYTGGTKKWQNNYASTESNNIILLTQDGYKTVYQDEKKNMGDANTFSFFLNYAYENYKSDKYNLIIYSHGLGTLGSITDDFTNDYLLLPEMKKGLENSPFNKNNKMESVLFRTCLNGTAEVASIYADYANYMIASEEITLGTPKYAVLDFINDVTLIDNGQSFGNKFISGYKTFIEELSMYQNVDQTYSVLDLSKQEELENNLSAFIKDINKESNYNQISKIRANLHQYAAEEADDENYDTVDLYEFVSSLKSLSSKNVDKVIDTLNSMVKENWSLNDHSHGLSIYLPYYGNASIVNMHFNVYSELDFSNEYFSFIKNFNSYKTNAPTQSMSFTSNLTSMKNKEFKIELTDEQVKNFAKANYVIYEKNDDGTYSMVVKSKASLKDNELVANLYNNIITVTSGQTKTFMPVVEKEEKGGYKDYVTHIILSGRDTSNNLKIANGVMHFKVKDDKVYESEIIRTEKSVVTGELLNLKDYNTFTFEHTKWNVLDENGNYKGPSKTDSMNVFDLNIKDGYEFELSSLDQKDYYCVFEINDVNNKTYYSNMEQIK